MIMIKSAITKFKMYHLKLNMMNTHNHSNLLNLIFKEKLTQSKLIKISIYIYIYFLLFIFFLITIFIFIVSFSNSFFCNNLLTLKYLFPRCYNIITYSNSTLTITIFLWEFSVKINPKC